MTIILGAIGILLGLITSIYMLHINIRELIIKHNKSMYIIIASSVFMMIITVLLYKRYGLTYQFISLEITAWLLISISITDIKYKEVNINIIIFSVILGVILLVINQNIKWYESLIGLFGIGGILVGISYITKGSIGMGDAYVIGVTGLLLGYKMAIAILLYSLVLSSILGIILMILGKVNRKTRLPMVPFILSAFIIIQFMQ
ncbi:MAG: A24 family peptidase [Vallitalea sp.]|jgi:prepilin signal peptidase PulO-like enzyme (type II secretory pathway)|nr:A24 family peptidase [Vallitalea sp.]